MRIHLRETEESIRVWFCFVGMFCFGLAALGILEPPRPRWFEWPLLLADFPVSIGYMTAAITLPRALRTSPTWILRLVLISRWLFSLQAVVSGLFGQPEVRGLTLLGAPFAFSATEHIQREIVRLWIEQRRAMRDDLN